MNDADKKRDDYIKDVIKSILTMDYIRPEEVPNIDLYMDQVTTFMDRHLESSKRYDDDKLLTKTMINNYTKNNLLPPPEKKKYSRDHMFLLMFIYYMKSFMPISDVQTLLNPLTEYFFDKKDYDMADTYTEIFRLIQIQSKDMTRDIIRKGKISQEAFSGVAQDEEEAEYLKTFAFICTLCFDIYMKKQVIDNLIDSSECFKKKNSKNNEKEAADKKTSKNEAEKHESEKHESAKKESKKETKQDKKVQE